PGRARGGARLVRPRAGHQPASPRSVARPRHELELPEPELRSRGRGHAHDRAGHVPHGRCVLLRAWNQYRVHRLPEAWDDIERARALRSDTAVYTLAGFIAFAQTDLETAAERLARAHELDRANCEAVWTEGLVHVELEAWEVAGARFGTAMACYASDADAARRERDAAAGANIAESIRARQVAEADKRAAASEHRRAQSAFNAASAYVRLRQKALALTYVDTAAAHPLLKDKAAVLRGAIEKLPDDE